MAWTEDYAHCITTFEQLKALLPLSESEERWFKEETHKGLPFCISPLFMREILKNPTDFNDPIRLQSIPRDEEFHSLPYESLDPLCEEHFSPIPGMVHRYRSRILVYAGNCCAHYCRHCFRRHLSIEHQTLTIYSHLTELKDYLNTHSEVDEILLSGGDPLLVSDQKLSKLLKVLQETNKTRVIRLCTRIPVTLPSRITPELLSILKQSRPLWVITHINHARELTPEACFAIDQIQSCGIPILNQTVLLHGINDDVATLKELFTTLIQHSIKPYYLFQGDLAAGTSHLRVPMGKGFELMKQLRKEVSGMALPTYAVDLPKGGGKIPLTENYLQSFDDQNYYFLSQNGDSFFYPNEEK